MKTPSGAPMPIEERTIKTIITMAALLLATGLQAQKPGMQTIAVTPPGRLTEAREPQAAADNTGRVYVTYGAGDALYCSASADGGKSWQAPVKVGEAGSLALGMRRGPRIAVAGKTVVVSAIYGREGKGRDGELLAWRSTDGGQSWQGPATVNDVPGASREGLHGMAAAHGGRARGEAEAETGAGTVSLTARPMEPSVHAATLP